MPPAHEVIDLSTPPITPVALRTSPRTTNNHNQQDKDRQLDVTVTPDDDDIQTSMVNMSINEIADSEQSSSSSDRDSFKSQGGDESRQERFSCPNGLHHSDAIKVNRCVCILNDNEKAAYSKLVDRARYV